MTITPSCARCADTGDMTIRLWPRVRYLAPGRAPEGVQDVGESSCDECWRGAENREAIRLDRWA